jgi:hypothetical protein
MNTYFLLRIPSDAAASLDSNLTVLWTDLTLPAQKRGDPKAFAKFAKKIAANDRLTWLRTMSHEQFQSMRDRLLREATAIVTKESGAEGRTRRQVTSITVGEINASVAGTKATIASYSLPIAKDVEFPWIVFGCLIPAATALITYAGLACWHAKQTKGQKIGLLSTAWILGLDEQHRIFDTACLVALLAVIGWALTETALVALRLRAWIVLALSVASLGWFTTAVLRFGRAKSTLGAPEQPMGQEPVPVLGQKSTKSEQTP